MEFCPTCGTRLTPIQELVGDKSTLVLVCKKCSFKEPVSGTKTTLTRVVKHTPQQRIALIGKEEQRLRTLPTIRVECPRCGNNRAYVWQVQTRGSDESSTQFFRCTKCNYTFREYS